MNKTYGRINWENYPSDETPLNESNLNKMGYADEDDPQTRKKFQHWCRTLHLKKRQVLSRL